MRLLNCQVNKKSMGDSSKLIAALDVDLIEKDYLSTSSTLLTTVHRKYVKKKFNRMNLIYDLFDFTED